MSACTEHAGEYDGREMIMPKMRVLYRASRAIRRFPDAHNQRVYHDNGSDGDFPTPVLHSDEGRQSPPCGTTLCQAGWIAWQNAPEDAVLNGSYISYPDGSTESIRKFATRVAGLTEGQAEAMFIFATNADEVDAMIDELEVNPEATEQELRRIRDNVSYAAYGS